MTRPRLVLADDADDARALLRLSLEIAGGYEVVGEARDGQEAVAVAARARPALILLDIAMPRLDGIEACRRLRADAATRGTTIVMLTAQTGGDDERRALAAGANRYLTKPFSPLDLLRLVDELPRPVHG